MSESIQSIANGTYSIGETNKLTFSAGPGIVIDEPSAGTVRIGTDETVLFDAGLISNHTSAATLSEPLSGFDKIEVRMVRGDTNYSECPTILYFEPRSTLTAVQVNWSVGQNGWYLVNQKLTWDNTHLYVNAAHALYGGSFATGTLNQETNTDLIRKTIVKVVGINRKEV